MKESSREIQYVLAWGIIAIVLSKIIWLLPAILLLPLVLAYTVDEPLVYLLILAIIGEMFSVLPPGIVSLVVFLPWLGKYLMKQVRIDVSLSFYALVLVTGLLQELLLFSPLLIQNRSLTVVPWPQTIALVVFSASVAFLVSVGVLYNRSW